MDRIEIAKIGKTVGLKGELKLHLLTDFPNQFKKNLKFSTDIGELEIEYYNNQRDVVKFKNYNSIEEAQKLINQRVFTNIEDTKKNCKLNKNEYFWFDILESKIVEDDKILGTIKDIERIGVSDYFIISTDESLVKQNLPKRFLLPYIDRYVLSVDIESKTIKVTGGFEILENS